ncbi:MAG: hypothetical protein EH225_04385, partial [Calditrichaeota bacterium]
ELFIGIDSSTQSCKIVIINPADAKIEYVDAVNYDRDLPQYNTREGVIPASQKGLSEADPHMWLDALEMLFRRLSDNRFLLRNVKAVSVSGQQHGLVSLDKQGNLSRPRSKLWNDNSTAEECELLTEAVGGVENMIREVCNTQRTGYTAGKIFHMVRHEPEAARKTTTFFLVHNYINWFLTGGIRIMEPGDVSGMALRFPGADEWSDKVCKAISPDLKRKLPPVKPSDQMIGPISATLAEKYGFDQSCLIDAGCGDNMYGAVGTGNIHSGIVTISLGTSGTAYTIFEEPFVDEKGEIASFCDSTGKYMPLLCVSNLANGYNRTLEMFNIDHDEFNRMINETPPGNKGKFILPWFSGERTPDLPHAAPVYFGFSLDDFSAPILCRAVLEGHILNLWDGYRRMPVAAREIRLTGGLSKSDAWCQTIADIFESSTVPVQGEGAALGAAMHAVWVYYKQNDPEFSLDLLTEKFVLLEENRRKNPQNSESYKKMKFAFSELSSRIRKPAGRSDPFALLTDMNESV